MKAKRPYRLIFTGGGTGGHIYPAIAVAKCFQDKYPEAEILFVGAKGKMEMAKVPEAGFRIIGLWISGLQRKMTLENMYFPIKLLMSFMSARKIIRRFNPDVVVGFGGYASGPTMLAATGLKYPTLIQEQNSYAGMTNKRIGKKVDTICVAYEGMEAYFPEEKIVITGNPVRKNLGDRNLKKDVSKAFFELDPYKKTVLVLGGSLGSRTINESILKGVQAYQDAGIQVIWQSGKFYYLEMKRRLQKLELRNVKLLDFIYEMEMAYAAADLVVTRAGALAIAEITLSGVPAILIPSPNVAEDHQTKNAMALTEKNAAVMVLDVEAEKLLTPTVIEVINNEEKCKDMVNNLGPLAKPNAAMDIVKELEKLIK